METKEKKTEEDNSHMFKRLASHNPLIYDVVLDSRALEDCIWGMEKLFDALQYPEEWKVRFMVFYLKDKADLWWVTVRERQHGLRFSWKMFKELIKDQFYLMSL